MFLANLLIIVQWIKPDIVAAMAQAAVNAGAVAVRIEGIDNLKATRPLIDVPIIGIVKRDLPDSPCQDHALVK